MMMWVLFFIGVIIIIIFFFVSLQSDDCVFGPWTINRQLNVPTFFSFFLDAGYDQFVFMRDFLNMLLGSK
jgi:hypothetical protein